MYLIVTGQYRAHRGAAICALALALGCACAAAPAQSLFDDPRPRRQFPPTLTLPALTLPAAAAPRGAPEPAIEKMVLDASAQFDFDTHELRAAGRAALDDFVAGLKHATFGVIRAVGHADRLGSEAYNQILSEDRAEAVKAYLVGKGIEPARVRAEGRGSAQPVTKRDECSGSRSAKLVACLQPDRRVGIEVAGTRPAAGSPGGPAVERNDR